MSPEPAARCYACRCLACEAQWAAQLYGSGLSVALRRSRRLDKAIKAADQVRRWGDIVELEPMNSYDRRIIHNALKDDPEIETHSVEVDGTHDKAIILRPKS